MSETTAYQTIGHRRFSLRAVWFIGIGWHKTYEHRGQDAAVVKETEDIYFLCFRLRMTQFLKQVK